MIKTISLFNSLSNYVMERVKCNFSSKRYLEQNALNCVLTSKKIDLE